MGTSVFLLISLIAVRMSTLLSVDVNKRSSTPGSKGLAVRVGSDGEGVPEGIRRGVWVFRKNR